MARLDERYRAAAAEDEGGDVGEADAIGLEPLDEVPPRVEIFRDPPVRVLLRAHVVGDDVERGVEGLWMGG